MRALDRFQYKLDGERSEPKIFITIFLHYKLLIKHFFLSFHEQTIFFTQGAEQTIYFPKFAEQSFFSPKNHSPPPQESNGRPLTCLFVIHFWAVSRCVCVDHQTISKHILMLHNHSQINYTKHTIIEILQKQSFLRNNPYSDKIIPQRKFFSF